ncbi:STAS domain-containing protein [Micromonospora sp. WMMD1120]|uniref:STAS domain-containing protein n=1 Tax=Micromonospora sp. WMMD1120 TaxID=3016106 RepID=UPI002415D805|nr:STAS domain-containing protein [Micromonospora sp. WMMD1120]MDG4807556.1 STAS domain-containing protein [Micromonospora sp. WMMD1120]
MWLSCENSAALLRVEVAGEIDMSNAHLLVELLESPAVAAVPLVTVDLSMVTFFGASGVDALVRMRALLSERGGGLTLRDPAPIVRRVLELTGTLALFGIPSAVRQGGVPTVPVAW